MEKISVEKSKCPQDHVCPLVSICPAGAISQEGFSAPQIDYDKCVACGACVATCPHQVMSLE
jgi:Fe-S-cluster-containing hydrogenase component 2